MQINRVIGIPHTNLHVLHSYSDSNKERMTKVIQMNPWTICHLSGLTQICLGSEKTECENSYQINENSMRELRSHFLSCSVGVCVLPF